MFDKLKAVYIFSLSSASDNCPLRFHSPSPIILLSDMKDEYPHFARRWRTKIILRIKT